MQTIQEILGNIGVKPKDVIKEFDKSKQKAAKILKNPNKTSQLLDKATKQIPLLSALPYGTIFMNLGDACSMISDYVKGTYRAVPFRIILSLTGAIFYLINPCDIIPDMIPFIGKVDDAFVFSSALKFAAGDIDKYRKWKEKNRREIVIQ